MSRVLIHTGTNDIPNKVNTVQKIRKVISAIKGHDTKSEIDFLISSLILRGDQDFEDQTKEFNTKLENFYKGKCMRFINNHNIRIGYI